MRTRFSVFVAAVVLAAIPPSVRAGAVENFLSGLGVLNFNAQGQRNILNGGHDLLINNNFQGNPLDFGLGSLTLQGPVSLDVSTGRRGIGMLDISFSTAINGNSNAVPLRYMIRTGTGSQAPTLSGTFLLDANFSFNSFGFYNFDLTISSRQTATQNGNVTRTNDADVGPIRASGNIYADMLSAITAPLFQAAGVDNPFDAVRTSVMAKTALFPMDLFPREADLFDDMSASLSPLSGRFPLGRDPLSALASTAEAGFDPALVPEPTVWLFLLLGTPVLFRKPLRRWLSSSGTR